MPPVRESSFRELLTGRYAPFMLALIATLESWFMPIIIEPFLLLPVMTHPQRWYRYGAIAATFSVIGGMLGYLTGFYFFDLVGAKLIALYGLTQYFDQTVVAFNNNAFWVILLGTVSPIPYKITTLVSGFLHVNFLLFVLASILGRGFRFMVISYVIGRFGERALPLVLRYFNTIAACVIALIVLYVIYSIKW